MSRCYFQESSLSVIARIGGWFLFLFALVAQAWGPHPAITQAALDSLGTNHLLMTALGPQTQRLTNYCWMADFKRIPFKEPDQDFYADDYLLFPQVPTHLDHICPEVRKTYRPYFQRALQALRTESQANAARWLGSLLHFVEDTGSPPHAAEIRGGVHSNMENWVDASRIHLDHYHPQLLGTNEAEALEGFVRRMDQLIEFSKPRGKSLVTPVLIGNKSAVQPVVLECALETSRVVADLLHTLGHLWSLPTQDSAAFVGSVLSKGPPGLERFPARVVLENANFSTLADASGRFEFRNLPSGTWHLTIFRPGSGTTNVIVTLEPSRTNAVEYFLAGELSNLVRNGDFKQRWIQPGTPDCWFKTGLGWEGEIIPLVSGQHYELRVDFKPQAQGDVLLRWTRQLPHTLPQNIPLPKIESSPLTPTNSFLSFTGSQSMALLQITVRSSKPPESVCKSVHLTAVRDQARKGKAK